MKFKLTGGAELDLLTKAEVAEVLAGWMAEVSRGIKFRKFSASGVVNAGTFAVGVNSAEHMGPSAGMVWSVTRIAVSGSGLVLGTDLWGAYANAASAASLIEGGLLRGRTWDPAVTVLNPNDTLVVAGVATGAGTDVTVSGAAIEIPVQLAWQLL